MSETIGLWSIDPWISHCFKFSMDPHVGYISMLIYIYKFWLLKIFRKSRKLDRSVQLSWSFDVGLNSMISFWFREDGLKMFRQITHRCEVRNIILIVSVIVRHADCSDAFDSANFFISRLSPNKCTILCKKLFLTSAGTEKKINALF